jgi:hypothetical protein
MREDLAHENIRVWVVFGAVKFIVKLVSNDPFAIAVDDSKFPLDQTDITRLLNQRRLTGPTVTVPAALIGSELATKSWLHEPPEPATVLITAWNTSEPWMLVEPPSVRVSLRKQRCLGRELQLLQSRWSS